MKFTAVVQGDNRWRLVTAAKAELAEFTDDWVKWDIHLEVESNDHGAADRPRFNAIATCTPPTTLSPHQPVVIHVTDDGAYTTTMIEAVGIPTQPSRSAAIAAGPGVSSSPAIRGDRTLLQSLIPTMLDTAAERCYPFLGFATAS